MSHQTGKFIPGGAGKNPTPSEPGRSEPIRAPAPEPPTSGKRLFAKGAAERLTKPVDPKRKPGITVMSAAACLFLISLGWYFLAVMPAKRRAADIQAELDKRNKEFEEFKNHEAELAAAEQAKGLQPAELKINTKPPGATITIGDIVHTAPADFKELKGGKYAAKIEMPGYETATREVTLEGSKTLDLGIIELVRKVGRMRVTSQLPNVSYSITGPENFSRAGQLPVTLDGLTEGDYTLTIEHKGWILPAIKLKVKNGEETPFQVVFPYASIQLDTIPSGATVRSGKKVIGTTPLSLKELRPGTLNYSIDLPHYKLAKAEFDVTEGSDLKKTIPLEKSNDFTTSFGMVLVKMSDFWGGKYEVKQSEYEKVMGVNPSFFRGGSHPVDSVTWNQAVEFCRKATEMEKTSGHLPDGYVFNLPTEPQWEAMLDDTNLDNAVTSRDADLHSTAEVGSSEPNQYGIYDMLGNVWEWCLDTFDPSGRTHVMRGGSWLSSKQNFPNSTVRNGAGENYRDRFTGFRIVLTKAPPP